MVKKKEERKLILNLQSLGASRMHAFILTEDHVEAGNEYLSRGRSLALFRRVEGCIPGLKFRLNSKCLGSNTNSTSCAVWVKFTF